MFKQLRSKAPNGEVLRDGGNEEGLHNGDRNNKLTDLLLVVALRASFVNTKTLPSRFFFSSSVNYLTTFLRSRFFDLPITTVFCKAVILNTKNTTVSFVSAPTSDGSNALSQPQFASTGITTSLDGSTTTDSLDLNTQKSLDDFTSFEHEQNIENQNSESSYSSEVTKTPLLINNTTSQGNRIVKRS